MINYFIEHWAETILLFIVVWWFWMRLIQKISQRKFWLNNFEFWIYYNLVDYYKFNWYPDPEKRAKIEIDLIIERKKEECNKIIDDKPDYQSIFWNL